MDVVAAIPVDAVIRSHSRTSASKPSQPEDVPFQPMTSTLACAKSSAARRISLSSNCASALADNAISVTLKREKCTLTSGRPATIAWEIGSRMVLEEGVNMPRRTRLVMIIPLRGACRGPFGPWQAQDVAPGVVEPRAGYLAGTRRIAKPATQQGRSSVVRTYYSAARIVTRSACASAFE